MVGRASSLLIARSSSPSDSPVVRSWSASSLTPTTWCGPGARVGCSSGCPSWRSFEGSAEGGAAGSISPGQRSVNTTSDSGCRRDQAARSRPGSGGRSSGQPRQSQPSVSTRSGRFINVCSCCGSNSVTQPRPSPRPLAVSQAFWMAAAHDHMSLSVKVARPRTPCASVRRSQQTTMPSGASRMPSSWRSSSLRALSGSRSCACRSRSPSAIVAARSRVSGSVTMMNRHGWECPTLGAWWAAVSTWSTRSRPTPSGRNRLMSRRAATICASCSTDSAGNAQPRGSSRRSVAEVASPMRGTGRSQTVLPGLVMLVMPVMPMPVMPAGSARPPTRRSP